MTKQKTIPELETEKAENERKLSQLQHKKQQIENRITYYEKGDRRKRAHRLITRGAAIESVAPLTKVLTETEFYAFVEKALVVPEVKGLLMEAVNEHNRAEQKERFWYPSHSCHAEAGCNDHPRPDTQQHGFPCLRQGGQRAFSNHS